MAKRTQYLKQMAKQAECSARLMEDNKDAEILSNLAAAFRDQAKILMKAKKNQKRRGRATKS